MKSFQAFRPAGLLVDTSAVVDLQKFAVDYIHCFAAQCVFCTRFTTFQAVIPKARFFNVRFRPCLSRPY